MGSNGNTSWEGLHQQKTICLAAGGRQVGRQEVLGTKPGFLSVVFCKKQQEGRREGREASKAWDSRVNDVLIKSLNIEKKVIVVDCVFL